MKSGYSYSAVIRNRAKRLRALADRTENVEQLEAIERDFEKLLRQAKRVQAVSYEGL